jgi:RimJ/RimL family protein N-acetyltransferase
MVRFAPIETERLIIRPLRLDDWAAVCERAADPELARFTGASPPHFQARDGFAKRVAEPRPSSAFGTQVIELKATGENIGYCGLDPVSFASGPVAELFYGLSRGHWGNGFALESAAAMVKFGFETMDLDEVLCPIHPRNERSIRVAERLGMEFRQFRLWPDYGMVAVFGLARTDYLGRLANPAV